MASDGEISCTNDPNFAVIYSFLKVFGQLYSLEVPSILKLQELIENTQEVLDPLKDLHVRLLRRALKSVQSVRWEKSLIKFCHQHGFHQEAWEMERFSYKKASTTVKLKVLKLLLEYQFTCHPKFKTAVNAISCKELRLDPVGTDKNGCVYWLQVDDDANLCLYKEDQDEETWQLIAKNREELVKVISQLKSGEEICPSNVTNLNEDSSSAEIVPQTEENKSEVTDDENEEFLSPESESDHEDQTKDENKLQISNLEANKITDQKSIGKTNEAEDLSKDNEDVNNDNDSVNKDNQVVSDDNEDLNKGNQDINDKAIITEEMKEVPSVTTESEDKPVEPISTVDAVETVTEKDTSIVETCKKDQENINDENKIDQENINDENKIDQENINDVTVGESIEEPVMVVTGEGNGADCECSFIIGEEIEEPPMYFYGEGCGYDNDTGNPEIVKQINSADEHSEEENNEECLNGEHGSDDSNPSVETKGCKLRSSTSFNKRALKKQSSESTILKPDSKKHCVRDLNKSESSNSVNTENELKRKGSVDNTDSESTNKNNMKKTRSKIKKKIENRKLKVDIKKCAENVVSDVDKEQENKSSVIEKRKSSLSSEHDDAETSDIDKDKSPEQELKAEEGLPSKKSRLESTPESDNAVLHSKDTKDAINNANNGIENKNHLKSENAENESISLRKKIKAFKGKFKRKRTIKIENVSKKSNDKISDSEISEKKVTKSLKRSLVETNQTNKSKSESHSDSDEDKPIACGKRLKIRPKKIVKSSRKKVEEKVKQKNTSDESEEETLNSISDKKLSKKVLKKKPRNKEKSKLLGPSGESDITPVRQSRRIAQMKIKEEADRRHMEEVALRELKMIHKKKSKDEDGSEEWHESGHGSSSSEDRRKKKKTNAQQWRAADSTGPDNDSDSDEPLFEHVEPDLEFDKSDHEFSPESDLESGEPVEPLKRARTLQEGADDGFCRRCGSGEQPEWILLCDACDAGYHASCLKPMLFLVPAGDWFCPPCSHEKLISSLESELTKYDELVVAVEEERSRRKQELGDEVELRTDTKPNEEAKEGSESSSESGSESGSWSSSSSGGVYRLRARRQLPVSYRSQEYDRLISSAIKEEYVEATTSAGNQGRGKDISTIIEAAEEEKLKAEREAIEQGKPIEIKKLKKRRKKARKLNSLEVPSEDDDETDEDFKDTGMESSSEDISSSAERDMSSGSQSSDDLPIRRACRINKKDRPKLRESSPEVKKKKGVFHDSSDESSGAKELSKKHKLKQRQRHRERQRERERKRERQGQRPRHKHKRLTQYDAMGNVVRARVTYGGLSDDEPNDWSPKHRTRQRKIDYTEMPNTESEDEMHKSSGKHMPDSSDEFKIDSDASTDSDSDRAKRKKEESENSGEEKKKALSDLISKTAFVPLEKLPEDVTKAKTEELQAHLNAQAAEVQAQAQATPVQRRPRGRGSRGGRGSRSPRVPRGNRAREPSAPTDDSFANLVGLKIKDLTQECAPLKPNQAERDKKKLEREAKQAEKEAKKIERLQKKEEKEKLKEQRAKEREEKRLARLALQESKRVKKEKPEFAMGGPYMQPARPLGPPDMQRMNMYPGGMQVRHPGDFQEQRFPQTPRLQVRPELRTMPVTDERIAQPLRADHNHIREGTLSIAGSPQPFKPVSEEPSIITRMPHMLNQQYRGPMMYPPSNSPYGPRGQNMMYMHHPSQTPSPRHQYPPQGYYPHIRMPPGYHGSPPIRAGATHAVTSSSPSLHRPANNLPVVHRPGGPHSNSASPVPPGLHGLPGAPHGPPGAPHGPPGAPHGPPGASHGPPGASHGPPGAPHGPPGAPHGPPGAPHGPPGAPHGPPGAPHGPPGAPHGPHGAPHGPPGAPHGPLGAPHGPPGAPHGPPGAPHGPPGVPRGPPGASHGPPGAPQGSPGTPHGPPGTTLGIPGAPHGHGSPGPLQGPSGTGPPGAPHGLIGVPRGPPGAPQGLSHPSETLHRPPGSIIHRQQVHGSSPGVTPHGPPHVARGPLGPLGPRAMPPNVPLGVLKQTPAGTSTPPAQSASPPADSAPMPPIKIKTEVKTEPEYLSPAGSPTREPSPRDEPPRNHPKIKHTENKDRRARYPLGPYAPQYGPYGPYAPPVTTQTPQEMHSSLLTLQSRLHAGANLPNYPYVQQHLRPAFMPLLRPPPANSPQFRPPVEGGAGSPPRAADERPPPAAEPKPAEGEAPVRVKTELAAEGEGSVFGGLVSYFSSQREDDIDA